LLSFPEEGGFLMHRGGNNVLFDDLHVDAYEKFDPKELTFDPTRMRSWLDVREDRQGP
jgi:hypothetical protein